MKLFKRNQTMLAICDGRCAPLSEMPDEAFASGMLGQGLTVFPTGGRFVSPVSGRIESIAESHLLIDHLCKDKVCCSVENTAGS